MGGIDKPSITVGGLPLLDRVLLATTQARTTVVVGPARSTCRPVVWRREDPVGGGPVAALAAGLVGVGSPVVVLLAADLPFLTAECVTALVAAAPGVLVGDGHEQWLCGAWPTAALRAAVARLEVLDGARLRDVLCGLSPVLLTWDGDGSPWIDCDTEEDVLRAREIA
ncbi:MAG: bifunctional protein IspD/ispF [Frankiales bacterium]|nr:bifunctional protein IspD/ispF [Frankiales bacterium]